MDTKKIPSIIVGYGYWGKNLLRNMMNNPDIEVVGVVEPTEQGQHNCRSIYPQLPMFQDLAEALEVTRPHAAVIATPPSTHCELAVQCLESGCHVLIEKPMALNLEECDKILEVARQKNRAVMVDHTFVHHPAVEYVVEEVHSGRLGDLLYYDSARINLGGFQMTNVLWDLAPHDLSILDFVLKGKCPTKVSAIGCKHHGAPIETMSYVNLMYDDNFVAHLHLNWTAPVKVRQVMLVGTEKMAIYDDTIPAEKVRIYDKGVNLKVSDRDLRINYRAGDMVAPVILQKEALAAMMADFVQSVRTGARPRSDGEAGRRVVAVLQAITKSIEAGGQPVSLSEVDSLRQVA